MLAAFPALFRTRQDWDSRRDMSRSAASPLFRRADVAERPVPKRVFQFARRELAPCDATGVWLPGLGADVEAHAAASVGDGERGASRRVEGGGDPVVGVDGQRRSDRRPGIHVPEHDRPVLVRGASVRPSREKSSSYTGFSQAAEENGLSRILVGFHFRKAVDAGIGHGRKIANHAVNNFLRPLHGHFGRDGDGASAAINVPPGGWFQDEGGRLRTLE
jgi:hypothetical protein